MGKINITQEEKELLLKDLCARLPYGVKLQQVCQPDTAFELYSIDTNSLTLMFWKYKGESLMIGDCGKPIRYGELKYKPYLRPMSSMTEDETIELYKAGFCDNEGTPYDIPRYIDYLKAHHFDYRGLIECGLAIAVTEDNNPYKEK